MRPLAGWLIALFLCAGAAAEAPPEVPRFRQIGVADGLPSVTVFGIDQDRDGYLWMATGDGLARYDGVAFRVWQHVPGDPAALPGNNVQALHIDAQDRIWLAVEGGGLSVLDPARRDFVHYRRATHPAIGSDDVWSIASTADGAIWFGTFGGGLHRLDADGAIHRFMPVEGDARSLPGETVLALAVDAGGELWVGTTAGLARRDGDGFERVPAEWLSHPFIYSLSPERDGRLWIGTRAGLDLRAADGRVAPVPWRDRLSDPAVIAVRSDAGGGRWIATLRGIDRERDGEVRPATPGDRPLGLLTAFEDRAGGLWFGSNGGGVAHIPAGWRRFGALPDPHQADVPTIGQVRGFAEAADGELWLVGAAGGLDRVDLRGGRIERVLDTSQGLPERRLWSVLQRRDGSVWIGHQRGLSRFDPATRRLRHWLEGETDAPLPGPVDLLVEDAQGRLWLSSNGSGVQARDAEGRILHQARAGGAGGLDSGDTEMLAVGPDGALWLAGAHGLLRWDDGTQRFVAIDGAPEQRVFAFAVAGRTVWLYRLGAIEAHEWDGERLRLSHRADERAGLPAVEGGGLVLGGDMVWVTTPRGLVRYRPDTGQVRVFGVRDGLPNQAFGNRPALRTRGGIGVAGTTDGLVLFDPQAADPESGAPRLVIEEVGVRRDERLVAFDPAQAVMLEPGDRGLRIVARLLAFRDPSAHRYRFRMTGHEPDWLDVGSSGERVFSLLPPGQYRLEVQAANADGVWSEPRAIDVVVPPPWWRTAWAFAIYALLALAAAWLSVRAYRRRLERAHEIRLAYERQRLALQASEAKTRFLATLGHEVRTPMTGVLGMAELLQGTALDTTQRGYVDAIRGAGEHLLRLVNDTLDLARIEAGRLELVDAPFAPRVLAREVADLLAPLAARKGLVFDCEVAADVAGALRGDAHRIRQILLNLGTNAIKFTERGRVAIAAAALSPQGLLVRVSDTGPGLSEQQQSRLFQRFEQAEGGRTAARYGGSGLGLSISQELAVAMGGRIRVDSAVGRGTDFIVELPLPVAAPAPPGAEARPAPTPRAAPGSRHILLVEDDETIARVMAGLLEAQGHTVSHVPHGLAALGALDGAVFDLALLDLDLPGIDGLELARLIRARGTALPLVAVTARSDADAETQARAAGMDGFLRKPVTGGVLAEAIEAFAGLPA